MSETREPEEEKDESAEGRTVEALAHLTGQMRPRPRNAQTQELLRQTWQGTVSRRMAEQKATGEDQSAALRQPRKPVKSYLWVKLAVIAILAVALVGLIVQLLK